MQLTDSIRKQIEDNAFVIGDRVTEFRLKTEGLPQEVHDFINHNMEENLASTLPSKFDLGTVLGVWVCGVDDVSWILNADHVEEPTEWKRVKISTGKLGIAVIERPKVIFEPNMVMPESLEDYSRIYMRMLKADDELQAECHKLQGARLPVTGPRGGSGVMFNSVDQAIICIEELHKEMEAKRQTIKRLRAPLEDRVHKIRNLIYQFGDNNE